MRALFLAVLVLLGCESEERTRLRLDIPPSARGKITSIEILLANDRMERCSELIFWATGSCGSQCNPDERDAALPPDPAQRLEIVPDESGAFGVPELDFDVEGPLEVFVIGHVRDAESIYGCRGLTRGERVDLPLWWPWCAAQACDRFFHPACNAQVNCSGGALTDPLDIQCESSEGVIPVWEQVGEECMPPVNQDRCRPAELSCEGTQSTILTDGICPDREREEMCVADSAAFMSAADIDCNGAHPLCDTVECTDAMPCGDGFCMGQARCRAGTLAECVFTNEEICNGVDDDCDRQTDEAEAVATACNARRTPGAPAADGCAGVAGCTCGDQPACNELGTACCRGSCVGIIDNPRHCGFCRNDCGDGRCVAGSCTERDVSDSGTTDAFVPECFNRGDCNLTHEGAADACDDGECVCGTGEPCAFPLICCNGGCVNPLDDVRHCGRCGRLCTLCDRGRCAD